MNKLIGRQTESAILEKMFTSDHAEFLALYGRRRIGKTFLIKHFFERKKSCVFFRMTGIKGGDISDQLNRFIKSVSQDFLKGTQLKSPTDWFEAFDALTDAMKQHVRSDRRIILFFDEFPWMVTHKSKLLQVLDHFWNQHWSDDPRIKLIICGSSASWIIDNIVNHTGGLHNRLTQRIILKPFSLKETKQFLQARGVRLKPWHVTQIYMATGGVPFYLSFVEKGQSSSQAIEHLAFSEYAPLLKEFDHLFAALFDDAETYIELLRIIASKRDGLSQTQIVQKAHSMTRGGRVTSKLKALQDAGFIMAFKPHMHKKKGVYYRVIDEYTLFYFHWIEPIRDTVQEKSLPEGYWQSMQLSPAWHSWSGYAFESIVYKHLYRVRAVLHIPPTAIANTWRYVPRKGSVSEGAQIDLLFDRRDGMITLCEIKFTTKPFVVDKAVSAAISQKVNVFIQQTGTKKQTEMALITANGLTENPYSDALISGVVTLEDLFV